MAELDRAGICRRIAESRERAGLTQPDLAEALSDPVHWRAVQNWERGKKNRKGEHKWVVPWDRLDEIARITGVTKDWLLRGDEVQESPPAAVAARLESIEAELRDFRAGMTESLESMRESLEHVRSLLEQTQRSRTAGARRRPA